jgi:hypothetical protein
MEIADDKNIEEIALEKKQISTIRKCNNYNYETFILKDNSKFMKCSKCKVGMLEKIMKSKK